VQNLVGIDAAVSIICKFNILLVRLEKPIHAPEMGL